VRGVLEPDPLCPVHGRTDRTDLPNMRRSTGVFAEALSEPPCGSIGIMSKPTPEDPRADAHFSRELAEESKSLTASGHSIGIEPSVEFVAPTMALDSLPSDSDD